MIPNLRFYFPKLVFVKRVTPGRCEGNEESEISLYRLDWTWCESLKQKDFDRWAARYAKDGEAKFVPSVTPYWRDFLDGMFFAVRSDYRREIERNVERALSESHVRRSFDTMARGYCMKTVETHVDVAFFLLSDCSFNEEMNYFNRRYPWYLIQSVMLWRFWAYQTGRGLIRDRMNTDRLRFWHKTDGPSADLRALISRLLEDFKKWETMMDEAIEPALSLSQSESGTVKGEDAEEEK